MMCQFGGGPLTTAGSCYCEGSTNATLANVQDFTRELRAAFLCPSCTALRAEVERLTRGWAYEAQRGKEAELALGDAVGRLGDARYVLDAAVARAEQAERDLAAAREALLAYWSDDFCSYDSDAATAANDCGDASCRAHVAYRALGGQP